jgi:hypothetical protein
MIIYTPSNFLYTLCNISHIVSYNYLKSEHKNDTNELKACIIQKLMSSVVVEVPLAVREVPGSNPLGQNFNPT